MRGLEHVKLALEVDFIPGQEEWIRGLAARHPWDYLIGAVHYVTDSWALDNPNLISEWKRRDPFACHEETPMTTVQLSDSQRQILAGACERRGGWVLPLTVDLKGGAV